MKKKLGYKSKQESLRVNCRTRKGFRSLSMKNRDRVFQSYQETYFHTNLSSNLERKIWNILEKKITLLMLPYPALPCPASLYALVKENCKLQSVQRRKTSIQVSYQIIIIFTIIFLPVWLAKNSSQLACSRNLPVNIKCTLQILY